MFDIPNEVLRLILSHLLPKQLINVMGVHPMWRFLARSGLILPAMNTLKEKYPFLITEKVLETFSYSEYVALLKKQQTIYARLAIAAGLSSPKYLERAYLQVFSELHQCNKENQFTKEQITFLEELVIASDVSDSKKDEHRNGAFLLMAQIGNLPKLKVWSEKHKEQIPAGIKPWVFLRAAENGHLGCVKHLIKKYKKGIDRVYKGIAFERAAAEGHLACVQYLIKKCGDLSNDDKGEALESAAENGHLDCVQHLIETGGENISADHIKAALNEATRKGHTEVVQYLTCPVSAAPTFLVCQKAKKDPYAVEEKDNTITNINKNTRK